MNRVKGYRNVTTSGTYAGEEGTGYGFGELASYGEFSQATGGHIQGSTSPVEFEILVPGAYLAKGQDGQEYLFPPPGVAFDTQYGPLVQERGLDAGEALMFRFIRLVEEEEADTP